MNSNGISLKTPLEFKIGHQVSDDFGNSGYIVNVIVGQNTGIVYYDVNMGHPIDAIVRYKESELRLLNLPRVKV